MSRLLCALGILLALHAAQATDLYRWVDKNGKVHYGDTPDQEEAEKLRISAPPASQAASGVDESALSYEARRARKNFPVTLYVSKECGDLCNQGREYLRKRKVPFTENMMQTPEEFDAFKKRTGIDGVPALSVGRTWLKGFTPDQWANELDAAGYPK